MIAAGVKANMAVITKAFKNPDIQHCMLIAADMGGPMYGGGIDADVAAEIRKQGFQVDHKGETYHVHRPD